MNTFSSYWNCACILTVLLLSSCGRGEQIPTDHPGALPDAWYVRTADPIAPEQVVAAAPAETEAAVDSTFGINAMALESVSSADAGITALAEAAASAGGFVVKDWTPWHLEGFIASFAISANGTFGFLSLDGASAIPAVKVTWRPRPLPKSGKHSAAPQEEETRSSTTEIAISPEENDRQLERQLEPVIRAAVSSGQVSKEGVLRQEILRFGRGFRQVCRSLSGTRLREGWKVVGYRLELAMDVSGKVTPVMNLGGTVGIRLDWVRDERQEERALARVYAGDRKETVESFPKLRRSALGRFAELVSHEVTRAAAESTRDPSSPHGRLRSDGFKLDEVRIGLGLSANGTIGIAQAQGNSMGSVVLGRDEGSQDNGMESTGLPHGERSGIPLVDAGAGVGVGVIAGDSAALQVGRDRFRAGLIHCLKVGAFFGRRAVRAETRNWMVSEVETAFDISVGGKFGLAQVNGLGIVALTFANEKFEEAGK